MNSTNLRTGFSRVDPEASFDTSLLSVIFCCDCDDLALVFTGEKRCDVCVKLARDEAATLWRVAINHAIRLGIDKPSRSPYDDRHVTCESCSEPACYYHGAIDKLDGIEGWCESCYAKGRISVDQDDESQTVHARFIVEASDGE